MLEKFGSLNSILAIPRNKAIFILSSSVFAMAIVLSRIIGLGPRVMSDELTYSLHSRLLPLAESPVPNYLYLLLYRTANFCGPEFYSCARLINVFFLGLLAVFVFMIASRFIGWLGSFAIALMTFVGPLSMYAANFMPDIMFFAGVAAFVWLYLRLSDSDQMTARSFVQLGIAVASIALIKPHGLLLLAVPVTHLLLSLIQGKVKLLTATVHAGVVVGAALIVKLGMGLLLAGPAGLVLFRSAYGPGIPEVQSRISSMPSTSIFESFFALSESTQSLIFASLLLFFVPIATAVWVLANKTFSSNSAESRLALAVLSLHSVFIFVVATFVSQVSLFDPSQDFRSQLRYFEFVFALYPILLASVMTRISFRGRIRTALVVVFVSTLIGIWWADFSKSYLAVYSDSVFNTMIARGDELGLVAVALSAIAALTWAVYPQVASRAWLFILFPLLAVISIPIISTDGSIQSNNKVGYSAASAFAKGIVDFGKGEKLIVIGSNKRELDATRFLLDEANVKRKVVETDDEVNLVNLHPKFEWVLIFGGQRYFAETTKVFEGPGWQLLRRDLGNNSSLNLESLGRAVRSVVGFESRGTLGLWTTGEFAAVSLSEPVLHTHLLHLKLSATPDLVGNSVFFSLGAERIEVPISASNQLFDITLQFANADLASDLVIDLPIGLESSVPGSLQVTDLIIEKP